jgi:hypothetical protein
MTGTRDARIWGCTRRRLSRVSRVRRERRGEKRRGEERRGERRKTGKTGDGRRETGDGSFFLMFQ